MLQNVLFVYSVCVGALMDIIFVSLNPWPPYFYVCLQCVCVCVRVCVCVCAYGAHFAQCMSGSALKGGGLEGRRGG